MRFYDAFSLSRSLTANEKLMLKSRETSLHEWSSREHTTVRGRGRVRERECRQEGWGRTWTGIREHIPRRPHGRQGRRKAEREGGKGMLVSIDPGCRARTTTSKWQSLYSTPLYYKLHSLSNPSSQPKMRNPLGLEKMPLH